MSRQKNIKIADLETNNGQIEGLPKNPRFIKDNRFKALVKSIEDAPEMLDYRTLLVVPHDKKYVIVAGNMRYRACKELGYKELPCYVLPEETPAEKLREYAIKDNIGFGQDDWDLLSNEWDAEELKEWGMETPEDWGEDTEVEQEVVEDEVPEEVETKCKLGDVWQLGEHRLMCGDSTKAEDVEKLMNGEKADMVFTDPPYNVAIGSKNAFKNAFQRRKDGKKGGAIEKEIIGDKGMTDEECGQKLWLPAFKNLFENAKDDCSLYVTMPQGGTHMMMMMMIQNAGWQVKHELIWVKNQPTFSMGRLNYDYQHEPILFGWKKTHNFFGKGEALKSIWQFDRVKCDLHPTMKPIALIANALKNSSEEQMNILDVFGGSGSTLIACEQLQRKCYTMELDEHYCDVIISRWEKLTGKKAEKIN